MKALRYFEGFLFSKKNIENKNILNYDHKAQAPIPQHIKAKHF